MFFILLLPNPLLFLLKERKKNTNIHMNIIKIKKNLIFIIYVAWSTSTIRYPFIHITSVDISFFFYEILNKK